MTKVIVDTDIGGYVDDVLCLVYLLSQPACELLGITTVADEADKRAMVASALCKAVGKRVPILLGYEQPLVGEQEEYRVSEARVLERWDCDREFPRGEAIEFLRRTIREHPQEIVLLTIGPLTNVAHLFREDPEVPSLLKGLVTMCGLFTGDFCEGDPVEWNAAWDIHATKMVYESRVASHRSIGTEWSHRLRMGIREFEERFECELLELVLDLAAASSGEGGVVTFSDALAAASVFDDGICAFERGIVEVEARGARAGMTRWGPNVVVGRHEVAVGVDYDRFWEHYFSAVRTPLHGSLECGER